MTNDSPSSTQTSCRALELSEPISSALWSVRLDSRVLGSPAVARGRIYVATRTSLWAIR